MGGASATRAGRAAKTARWRSISARRRGCLSPRRKGDEQAAVVVVGREDVRDDRLLVACAGLDGDLLPQPADAPFACQLDGPCVGEAERLDDVSAHQVGLRKAGPLEDAAPDRAAAPFMV